jgi:hypothetical protein
VGFRVSKVELEFPRIEPTCLYGLDDRIPPHFLEPHEPQRNEGLGRGTVRLGLSGVIASLVVAVPRVTHRVTGRFVRALGMNCLRVRGGAGLAPAAGLIRSLSAFSA